MKRPKRSRKKVVVIGGGTGVFTLLTGLKERFERPAAIITMADSGGSTGVLREEFGILPPGDVRQALIALSEADNKLLAELFNYRFSEGTGLRGHSFGNLMLTALERITGSFERALEEVSKILGARGEIIPVTLKNIHLFAELENGEVIRGEGNIYTPKHNGRLRIERVWLSPEPSANPRARQAILDADLVVIGPGGLYTSIVPNLLVKGVPQALKKTKAKIAYVVNCMTRFGETNGFRASDFVREVERYAGKNTIDYVLIPTRRPSSARLRPYAREHAEWVEVDEGNIRKVRIVRADLVRSRGFVRHDPEKTARVLASLL